MIERDDLKAAVSAGVLNEAQAASLAALADSRRGARENLAPGDEPFELFKGFNEIFIVIGLVILASGWIAVTGVSIGSSIGGTLDRLILWSVVGGVILWLLSEYFIRRRRMVAPAIALTFLFAGNAAAGFNAWLIEPFLVMRNDFSSLPVPLILTTAAVFGFWLRFRVPIALALVALGLFAAAVVYSAASGSRPETMRAFFQLSAEGGFAWITLALGICTFLAAMVFDMSDPHRVTRRSANGFWLHVIAAPALVNTVALSLFLGETGPNTSLLIPFLAAIALVAIIIDRRSFLITAVGYLVALGTTLADDGSSVASTILILGIFLVTLGAFWERIRAAILRVLGPALPLSRLPPSV
jgi:hypothetical protein